MVMGRLSWLGWKKVKGSWATMVEIVLRKALGRDLRLSYKILKWHLAVYIYSWNREQLTNMENSVISPSSTE